MNTLQTFPNMDVATITSPLAALQFIPDAERAEYAGLPTELQKQFATRVLAMLNIASVSGKGVVRMIHAEAAKLRMSFEHVRRMWYRWRNDRMNWRVLINRSKAGADFWEGEREALPVEFLDHWKSVCGDNQRKSRPQYRALMRRLESWRKAGPSPNIRESEFAIPGYSAPPLNAVGKEHPAGWSLGNLYRHLPSKFELKARRIGRVAAGEFRPGVFTTRVGLEVMQFVMFDDLWHDFKVNFVNQRHAQRLLQFHAHDLFSACNFARGMKPVMENEVTGAQERLKEREMWFLVAHVLAKFGYRRAGTVLCAEHGTAAIPEAMAKLLFDFTKGAVTVERSGIEGAAAFAGMYAGRSKGNFKFKASLESSHNLIHNETADILLIPGQVGSNGRIASPEELHGRERHNDALLNAIAARPDLAGALRLPFLEFSAAQRLVTAIHELINARPEHDLEGWVEAGLTRGECRVDASLPWMDAERLLLLDAVKRAAVQAVIESSPDLMRTRKLSPAEVFARGSANLVKLDETSHALLLGDLPKREVKVRNQLIEFEDGEISPSPLRYLACINGEYLPDGEKFERVVNPMDLTRLLLFNAKGGYVGSVQRWGSVSRADTESLHKQMGAAAKVEKDLLAPVAKQGARVTRQRIEDSKWNAEHLGVTKEEQQQKQNDAALAKAALLQTED